jgi:hypothetical protein
MSGISVTPEDVLKARGSNFLDDMDTVYSEKDGRICVVAKKNEMPVCWNCGQPFSLSHPDLEAVEKTPVGGTVPIMLHRRCEKNGKKVFSMSSVLEVSKGLGLRRTVARVIKPFLK